MVVIRAVKQVGMTVMRCCGEHGLGRVVTTEAHSAVIWCRCGRQREPWELRPKADSFHE